MFHIFTLRYSRLQSARLSRVRRSDGSGRVLPLFGYYIILNFFKGPIFVQCIQCYYLSIVISILSTIFLCGSCSRGWGLLRLCSMAEWTPNAETVPFFRGEEEVCPMHLVAKSRGTLVKNEITSREIKMKFLSIFLPLSSSTSWKLFSM